VVDEVELSSEIHVEFIIVSSCNPLPARPPVTRKFGVQSLHETMNQKGRCENPPIGVSHRKTTGGVRWRGIGGGHDFLQSIECIHYQSLVSLHLA